MITLRRKVFPVTSAFVRLIAFFPISSHFYSEELFDFYFEMGADFSSLSLSLYISLVPMVPMAAMAPITNASGISKEKANSRILMAHHQRGEPFSSVSHTVTAHPQHGRRWTVPILTLTTSRSYSFVRTSFIEASLFFMATNSNHRYLRILVRRYRRSQDDPTFAEHLQPTRANMVGPSSQCPGIYFDQR